MSPFAHTASEVDTLCLTPGPRNGPHLILAHLAMSHSPAAPLSHTLFQVRTEGCDDRGQRRHRHMKGLLNEVEKVLVLHYFLESLLKLLLQLFRHIDMCIIAVMFQCVWLGCGDCSEVWEMNKLSVRYEECGAFVLKCWDHTQHVAGSFCFPSELEIHRVQVRGDVR